MDARYHSNRADEEECKLKSLPFAVLCHIVNSVPHTNIVLFVVWTYHNLHRYVKGLPRLRLDRAV